MARLGPKKQRLTRAEWKAQKEHAMKVAAAESAVLDSAATKEKEAHKRPAVQEHAELLAKEKRDPRGDAEGASPASRGEGENRAI